ncbi:putative serine-rich protein isoform X1 [Astyanax mexicanus]|uniref:Putative serine-rich protein isoform X1 n=1 Tax=Astyanax mexicanus TaxID=7994 RepID=A0A8T2KZ77_ASTMX|nr:putative serine-rich protein isoform X1 [Astyanax mexicanus]
MTLDGYQKDVMRNKTWTCWIFFAGFVLSLGVARDCNFLFKNHITDELLLDHWFEIRYFQHPDETVKDGYTLLSIVNIMCTSLKKYGHDYDDLEKNESRRQVTVSYRILVNKILNLESKDDIPAACERHACNYSFSKSYISPDELEKEFRKECAWNGTLPATSPSPSQVSHATSTPSPTNSPTSTPSHTTTHQSTRTTTSLSSQPRNMTSPSASNNTKTPPAYQPTSSTNVTENSGNMQKNQADLEKNNLEKNKDNIFLSLLTVSCTVNVALIILVLWQCRSRRPNNLQDYFEDYHHHHHNVELVYLSKEKNQSEGNHHPLSESTFLHNREQSEDNVNSSYSAA